MWKLVRLPVAALWLRKASWKHFCSNSTWAKVRRCVGYLVRKGEALVRFKTLRICQIAMQRLLFGPNDNALVSESQEWSEDKQPLLHCFYT